MKAFQLKVEAIASKDVRITGDAVECFAAFAPARLLDRHACGLVGI